MKRRYITLILFVFILSCLTSIIALRQVFQNIANNPETTLSTNKTINFSNESFTAKFKYSSDAILRTDKNTGPTTIEDINILFGDKNFSISLSTYIYSPTISKSPCSPDNPCGAVVGPILPFEEKDFENILEINGRQLFLSKEGGETLSSSDSSNLVSRKPRVGESNMVYEKKLDGISDELTINRLKAGSEDTINISYVFKTEEAINQWPEYKKELINILRTLEFKDISM